MLIIDSCLLYNVFRVVVDLLTDLYYAVWYYGVLVNWLICCLCLLVFGFVCCMICFAYVLPVGVCCLNCCWF